MFSTRPGLILFTSDLPGSHATLFGPNGRKLPFRDTDSSFNDEVKVYTWAFFYDGILEEGDKFVFATADRNVTGEVKDGVIGVTGEQMVVRREEGKPVGVVAVGGEEKSVFFRVVPNTAKPAVTETPLSQLPAKAFVIRSGLVCYFDRIPRSYVSMRGPNGQNCPFRNEASHFDESKNEYLWAFAFNENLVDEQQFVFSAGSFEVVGEVKNGEIVVVPRKRLAAPPIALPRSLSGRGVRILAIFPGVQSPGAGWGTLSHASANNESAYMAHGMSYVSSYLKSRGHQVWLLDTRGCHGWEHFADEVARQDYDFAMLGPLSIEAFTSACIVRILKETHPDRPVILGGLHVSMTKDKVFPPDDLPKYYFYQDPPSRMREYLDLRGERAFDPDIWPKADYVVWNEGELVTAAIVEGADLKNGDWDYEETQYGTVFVNGKVVPDLNQMPHMDRNLFNEELEKMHPLLPELPAPFHTITFGRGCPYKCSFSLAGDTVTFTDVGPVEIQNIASGIGSVRACAHGTPFIDYRIDEQIATTYGRARATHAIAEGVQPVLRVTTEGGITIKATAESRILCVADDCQDVIWRRVDELKPEHFAVIRRPDMEWPKSYTKLVPPEISDRYERINARRDDETKHRAPEVLDERLAWLAGFLVGDGCLPSDDRAAFHFCVFPDLEQKQRAIVRELFVVDLKIYPAVNTEKMLHGWVYSRLAREVLSQSVGIDFCDKLKIPAIFWKAPKTVLAAFVDGLFDADAYVPDNAPEYLTTVSERLAREVGYALLMLGRGCPNIIRVETEERGVSWRVGILQNDRIPSIRSIYKSEKSGLWYWRTQKGPNRIGIRRRTLIESGLHHPLNLDGWYYVRLRSVEECLAEPVFDVSVPNDDPDKEAFVANGFVVHNCSVGEQFSSTKVRLIDPDYFMEELHALKRANGNKIGSLMIHDDILLFPKWLASWAEKIKQQFTYIPWWCQMRADFIVNHPDLVRHMAEAGMTWVSVGYEVGHARGLNGIMNKDLKVIGLDDPVEINIRASEVLKQCGVNSFGNFMFGNPTETSDEMLETVKMIQRIQPQHHGFSTYCDYPGTALSRLVTAEGLRMQEWYTRSHYPWQYRIKGVDYDHVNRCIQMASMTPKTYLNPIRAGVAR